jgi:hypothetical protein
MLSSKKGLLDLLMSDQTPVMEKMDLVEKVIYQIRHCQETGQQEVVHLYLLAGNLPTSAPHSFSLCMLAWQK